MECKIITADPLMYYFWTIYGLLICLSCIDECLCVGNPIAVYKYRDKMKRLFDCDDVGDMVQY